MYVGHNLVVLYCVHGQKVKIGKTHYNVHRVYNTHTLKHTQHDNDRFKVYYYNKCLVLHCVVLF